jgi:hypothetical protein
LVGLPAEAEARCGPDGPFRPLRTFGEFRGVIQSRRPRPRRRRSRGRAGGAMRSWLPAGLLVAVVFTVALCLWLVLR